MESRFNRNLSSESKGSITLQKKLAESRRPVRAEPVPDLTDFMNDMFFGTVKPDKKSYNLMGNGGLDMDDEESSDDSRRSNSSRLTQEWLDEAKRMVASSPSRCDSPSRLVGSPRFAASQAPRLSVSSLDRRDPLSRSARRHRQGEGFSGEILSKSAKHSRNNSETFDPASPTSPAADISPASAVHRWFSNILKPSNPTPPSPSSDSDPTKPHDHPVADQNPTLLLRQSTHRRSRFQNDPNAAQPQGIPVPQSKRTFKTTTTPAPPLPDPQLLSPPKTLIESAQRRSISSSTCSYPEKQLLSPPRNLVESANRRSISSSTCSTDKILWKQPNANGDSMEADLGDGGRELNGFLKEQRIQIEKILKGETNVKAKIVLSGTSNSTSSMVAAICYAWLLENRMKMDKDRVEEDGSEVVVVPVMNVRRGRMWKQRQAAWLFHHTGVDPTTLLFCDEVDLETLMMAKKLSVLVVGQDILRTNGEVGSHCTILTDNYCEDAYDLLQTPLLKKLLLAGILLDTQNLNKSTKLSMTRDAEAVQLLSVGSAPNYKNALYDQLMQDQRDGSFFETLRHNYGKPPNDGGLDNRTLVEHMISEKPSHDAIVQKSDKNTNDVKRAKTPSLSPKSVKTTPEQAPEAKPKPAEAPAAKPAPAPAPAKATDASRGKNKFFLAKWFGFSSK